jgi:hypothetical protein
MLAAPYGVPLIGSKSIGPAANAAGEAASSTAEVASSTTEVAAAAGVVFPFMFM